MREYLIEKVLPSRELHILGGPSGAGKTRLLFQWLRDWQAGKPFLFDPKTNEPFAAKPDLNIAYIAYDRSEESIQETMDAIGPIPRLKWKSARSNPYTLRHIRELFPDVNLVVIDAIASAVPMGRTNDYVTVAGFCRDIGVLCTQQNFTVLAIHHTAKAKENESYLNPRQRLSGSGSWAAFSDTVFLLEPINPDDPEKQERRLFVGPRNSAEFIVNYTFKNGQLVKTNKHFPFDNARIVFDLLGSAGNGPAHITALVMDCELFGLTRATVYRAIEHLISEGIVFKPKEGYVQLV
jgi:RecA-family ATPase